MRPPRERYASGRLKPTSRSPGNKVWHQQEVSCGRSQLRRQQECRQASVSKESSQRPSGAEANIIPRDLRLLRSEVRGAPEKAQSPRQQSPQKMLRVRRRHEAHKGARHPALQRQLCRLLSRAASRLSQVTVLDFLFGCFCPLFTERGLKTV